MNREERKINLSLVEILERWRTVPGYEELYEISSFGRIRSIKFYPGKLLKEWIRNRSGYLAVTLRKNGKSSHKLIHRLIAEAFIPNPENLEYVCHIDDNPLNNSIDNLKWGSPKDNSLDKILNGNQRFGENCYTAKLTNQQAFLIREMWKSGDYLQKDLSKMFGIAQSNISQLVNNKKWRNVSE